MRISQQIQEEILSWPDTEVHGHRFGGIEFKFHGKELGHLHGDYLADLPFPLRVGHTLIEEGKAQKHHYLTDTAWVSYPIGSPNDIPSVITLFRMQYDRLVQYMAKKDGAVMERGH